MAPSLDENYRDMLCLLNAHGVEFLLIGGWALSFYGAFRYTEDINLWVRHPPENARRLTHALKEFGAPLDGMEEEDGANPRLGPHIGSPPCRIDLLTVVSGVDFDLAWTRRVEEVMGGQ